MYRSISHKSISKNQKSFYETLPNLNSFYSCQTKVVQISVYHCCCSAYSRNPTKVSLVGQKSAKLSIVGLTVVGFDPLTTSVTNFVVQKTVKASKVIRRTL